MCFSRAWFQVRRVARFLDDLSFAAFLGEPGEEGGEEEDELSSLSVVGE